jgi:hypothetical protein
VPVPFNRFFVFQPAPQHQIGAPVEAPHGDVNHAEVLTGTAAKPIRVSNKWVAHVLTFLMVFGPGLIVMEADNDAAAVSTYVQAGAQYGTHLPWLLLVLLPISYFVQEMVVRLGIATGRATPP